MNTKILVIEDDPEIVESIGLALQIYWSEAVFISARLGQDGIHKAYTEKPDVIILDLGLPDIDGYEVLNQVRMFTDIPVIILTARNQEEDMVRAFDGEAIDYVVKPFRQKELLARVQTHLTSWMTNQLRVNMM